MALTSQASQRRPAFTLVELLVAMALILFIMVILSEAFVAGLGSFRELKAVGDLQEKLRSATMIMRRDLAADHFEARRRLSDPNFWIQGQPREGFFYLYQDANSFLEGTDSDRNPSYRSPVANPTYGSKGKGAHFLYFTVKLRGNNGDRFFSANVPSNSPLFSLPTNFFNQPPDANFQDPNAAGATLTYNSPWAEVCYFLDTQNPTFAGTTPLYSLYRTQLVVVPDTRQINRPNVIPAAAIGDYLELSCSAGLSIIFHNPTDLAEHGGSLDPRAIPGTVLPAFADPMSRLNKGTSLLLTDVISFDVRVLKYLWRSNYQLTDFTDANPHTYYVKNNKQKQFNPDNPADQGWATNPLPWAFHTYGTYDLFADPSSPNAPPEYCISALEITLRVWDAKTEQARQVTIIQDM